MSEAAEHHTRDCAQYHARAKSQPGLGTGRNGKGQSDHAKDGNRPGLHARSPAVCRTLLNGRVWQSSQPDVPGLGVAPTLQVLAPEPSLEIESPSGSLIARRLGPSRIDLPSDQQLVAPNLTVPRIADCNKARLSNFNQCCFCSIGCCVSRARALLVSASLLRRYVLLPDRLRAVCGDGFRLALYPDRQPVQVRVSAAESGSQLPCVSGTWP